MINKQLINKYKVTIGIECHVQLKTKTKLFSGASNDAREAQPNTLVNHIDFGLPGALPVLNQQAITLGCQAAFALKTRPQSFSKFDRKHYFYPDLPMGYQITQYQQPIILGGQVDFVLNDQVKTVRITRAHLEADAGKSSHHKNYSLVDLNRAGTPLLEIVSEPDMHSAQEAKAYARELYLLMKYAKVSEADLYYGNMRFDVNVSVSQSEDLGIRTETKNLNSFRSVERAIDYEVERQIELLEKGLKIIQETRGWNEAKQKTFTQRTKENADDYRYMPDPDLPPVILDDEFIDNIENTMSIMPNSWRDKLIKLNLDTPTIETLIEANVALDQVSYLELIDQTKDQDFAKFLANWFVNLEIPLRSETDVKLDDASRLKVYQTIYSLLKNDKLSSTNVKLILSDLLRQTSLPEDIETYTEAKGLIQESDEKAIKEIVITVLKDNPKAVSDIKNGETKAIGFLVGQVMKLSQGKANPAKANQILIEQIKLLD